MMDLLELAARADAIGVKIEVMNGLPIWEAFPNWKHQAIDRIYSLSPVIIELECGCTVTV